MLRVLWMMGAMLVMGTLCSRAPTLAWSRQVSAAPAQGALTWKSSILVLADVIASLNVETGSINWVANVTLGGVPAHVCFRKPPASFDLNASANDCSGLRRCCP